jgi:hypothetical protein
MNKLCAPAIIYLLFSITQMLIDTYKGLYNTVGMKAIVTIMVTLLLNILCERGLGVISWIIVFIPFILMTVIVSMLLYVFGLDVASGTINKKQDITNVKVDENGNIIIYDPYYNALVNPVYYKQPNIIVPKPPQGPLKVQPPQGPNIFSTSDPAYTS